MVQPCAPWGMTKAAGSWRAADLVWSNGWVPAKCLTKWLSRLPGACVGAQSWQDALVSVMHCSSEVMAVNSVACSMLLNLAIF